LVLIFFQQPFKWHVRPRRWLGKHKSLLGVLDPAKVPELSVTVLLRFMLEWKRLSTHRVLKNKLLKHPPQTLPRADV